MIPREFGNTVNLTILQFARNNITSIHRQIGSHPSLERFFNGYVTGVTYDIITTARRFNTDFSLTHGRVNRIVGENTFTDLGKLCVHFLAF